MPQPSNQFNALAYFDKILAAKYDRRIRLFCPSYDALHQMLVPWLASMPEHSLFLSAGAGTGAEILTLGTQFPSWRFIAVDISPDMLTACRQRLLTAGLETRVTFFNGSLQEYQPQELVDAASSVFVSHFIKDRKKNYRTFDLSQPIFALEACSSLRTCLAIKKHGNFPLYSIHGWALTQLMKCPPKIWNKVGPI